MPDFNSSIGISVVPKIDLLNTKFPLLLNNIKLVGKVFSDVSNVIFDIAGLG